MQVKMTTHWKIQVVIFCALCICLCASSGGLEVISSSNGAYKVLIDGTVWLTSSETELHCNGEHHSTKDGTLKLISTPVAGQQSDMLGNSNVTTMKYGMRDNQQQLYASIRQYADLPAVVFSQNFPGNMYGTSMGDKTNILSSFPSFNIGDSATPLGYMVYGDSMIGHDQLRIGLWKNDIKKLPDGLLSGPMLLFDKSGKVLVISPFSQFMANSYYHENSTVSWGIMGDVDYVPAGFTMETVLFYSSKGINKALEEWGEMMRYYYNRDQSARKTDISNNYIGYYTDHGAYYYHATEPGMNYEETIMKAYDYSKEIGIPYRYIQYDDWFYPIEGPGYGATVTWDAMPSIFPHGLIYLFNYTGLPVVAHNRYWSHKTTYAKQNGGRFNFIIDEGVGEAIPDDQEFWDYLLSTAKEWGLVTYEQDWLNHQMEVQTVLHSDLSMGPRWLQQMGEAATRNGLTVQYCMCLPRELMQALLIPAVSHARASGDYVDEHQWRIGITSMFADAMGVAPFKDNFWSVADQPGNRYKRTEVNVEREATVALLSTGPVGPSDRIYYTNTTLLHRLINADGLLLKPSKPATAIDQQIIQQAFGGDLYGGELWSTYSEISHIRFGLVFASELDKAYSLTFSQLGWNKPQWPLYSFPQNMAGSDHPRPFSDVDPLLLQNCGKDLMCLHYTTPALSFSGGSVLLLGELNKQVPMSPQRVTAVTIATNDVTVALVGPPGEEVIFSVWMNNMLWDFACQINKFGRAVISVADKSCQ